MKAYSVDLRERVVRACETSTAAQQQIAERFSVSTAWIGKLRRQPRKTGARAPRPHGGGRPAKYQGEALAQLRAAIQNQPDATLEELREPTGARGSIMAVHRAIPRLRGRFKKSPYARRNRIAPTCSRRGKRGANQPSKRT